MGTTHYLIMGAGFLGILGTSYYYYSYNKYIELQNLRTLEHRNLNIQLNFVIKKYADYNKILECKEKLLIEKYKLEKIININNLEEK
jgi:hypothetical protein